VPEVESRHFQLNRGQFLGQVSASADLDPEVRRIVANLEHDPRDIGHDIAQTVSAADILRIARAAGKKEERMTTAQMIAEVAKCLAKGRPYWPVALKLRPDLPPEKAKHYLRSRVSKKRAKIDTAVRAFKRKHVTS
jgi:hypothetical protein